jgi:glucose-1-phosphate thymidylyltransferase
MLPEKISEVIIIVGFLKEKIIDYFGEEYNGLKITYIEQKKINGTAGALVLGKDILEKEEKFLVLMADDFYLKSDLEKLVKNNYSTLAFEEKEKAYEFGVFKVDEDNFLLETIEKPKNQKKGYVGVNAYVLGNKYFKTEMFLGDSGEY